jgi:hypothetical protein
MSPVWAMAIGPAASMLFWGWLWFFVPTGGRVLIAITAALFVLVMLLVAVGGSDVRLCERGVLAESFTSWADILEYERREEIVLLTVISRALNTKDFTMELFCGGLAEEATQIIEERTGKPAISHRPKMN